MVFRHIHDCGFLRPPGLSIDSCPLPVDETAVHGLTIIDVREGYASGLGCLLFSRYAALPFTVGDYILQRAVSIFDIYLHEQGYIVSVSESSFRFAYIHAAAVPARRNCSRNCIPAFLKQGSHIIGLILETFAVACPAGCELIISDSPAVDECFIYSV